MEIPNLNVCHNGRMPWFWEMSYDKKGISRRMLQSHSKRVNFFYTKKAEHSNLMRIKGYEHAQKS